jgi:hypothetical protein
VAAGDGLIAADAAGGTGLHTAAVGEQLAQLAAATLHPRLHAGDAEAHRVGDLGLGLPTEIDGADRRAVGLGELVDEGAQAAGELAVGGLRVVGEGVLGGSRCSQVAGVEPSAGAAAGAVGSGQMLDRQPALACGREGDGGSNLGLGPLVRHAEAAEKVKGVTEVPGGAGGIAVGQRQLTQGMPEPGHRLGRAERSCGLGEQLRRAGDVCREALAGAVALRRPKR